MREAMSYYRRAWARDGWHWRAIVVFLVVACAVDIGLLAAVRAKPFSLLRGTR